MVPEGVVILQPARGTFDDYESLTRPESLRLIAAFSRLFRVWEEAFLLYQAGYLEKRTWETMLRQFSGYLSVRPFYEVWAIRKQYFDNEFQDFVDSLDPVDYFFLPEDQRDA